MTAKTVRVILNGKPKLRMPTVTCAWMRGMREATQYNDSVTWAHALTRTHRTAHISDTISITWDTSLPSKYDNMTAAELFELNFNGGRGWVSQIAAQLTNRSAF